MVNIEEFNLKLLAKHGIAEDNIRAQILNFLVGDFTNEINDTTYTNLKNIFESEVTTLQSGKKTINLKNEESESCSTKSSSLFVDYYEAGLSDNFLTKRAVIDDMKYGSSIIIYIKSIRILELNLDGSIIYINVERYDYSNTKFKIEIKYYNEDTVRLIDTEKENIDVYELLDDLCIHCDNSVSKSYDTTSYSDLLPGIDECIELLKKELEDNTNKGITLKMEDK